MSQNLPQANIPSEDNSGGVAHPPLGNPRSRRNVTLAACEACRRRKSKCDGQRPICAACVHRNSECTYTLPPTERRSVALKRKNEDLDRKLNEAIELYRFLVTKPEDEAINILRRLRTEKRTEDPTEDMHALLALIRGEELTYQHQQTLQFPSHEFRRHSSLYSTSTTSSSSMAPGEDPPTRRRRTEGEFSPLAIDALIHSEDPLKSLSGPIDARFSRAKHWTTVTQDEGTLSHLLTVFFSSHFPLYHWFDKELFLNDLVSGKTHFCSSALVNAILACACSALPISDSRPKPFENNLTKKFFEEARRLLRRDNWPDCLTKLHCSELIAYTLYSSGKDKIGHSYQLEALRIASNLGLFYVYPPAWATPRPTDVPKDVWKRVHAVSCWGLFNWQVHENFDILSKSTMMIETPCVSIPYDDEHVAEATFRESCRLATIQNDCAITLFSTTEERSYVVPRPESVELLYRRLVEWHLGLPASLDVNINTSVENLVIQMRHLTIIIRLFKPFLLEKNQDSRHFKRYSKRARNIIDKSLKRLIHLIHIYGVTHAWAEAGYMCCFILTMTAFGCLDKLQTDMAFSNIEINDWYSGFMMCIRALSNVANTHRVAQVSLKTIREVGGRMQLNLPDQAQNILNQYHGDDWVRKATEILNSRWVIDMSFGALDLERARLDVLLKEWQSPGSQDIYSEEDYLSEIDS